MEYSMDELVRFLNRKGPLVLLESQSEDHPASQYSYLAAMPKATIRAEGNHIKIQEDGTSRTFKGNPWEALSNFYATYRSWLFGYLGYDLKNSLEDLESCNRDLIQAPDYFFMIPELLLRIPRKEGEIDILAGVLPGELQDETAIEHSFEVGPLQYSISRESYLSRIEEAQRQITEGNFYEINLSHQLHVPFKGDPFELYRRMRKVGPVPFGAFLSLGNVSVGSLSPERFLGKKGKRVFSQPIKGTTKRGSSAVEDEQLRQKLRNSVKNRAENLMIVDLVRNDLSRIARRGSVNVSELFEIQTFGTVHQMVSTIEAETDIDDPVEIIKACYPMGSMTGAPKISAMKAIEDLENYRRGIYSGAIGYIDPVGDFDFNVVIRTAIISRGKLYYSVGGAITGDSDPGEEWEETLVKARALTDVVMDFG